ncbi:MAG: serine hydrolase domain-containing protein [Thermomicrobiales bacterium]
MTTSLSLKAWPDIDTMETTIRTLMTKHDVPRVNVLISSRERETWIASFGVANRDTNEAMRPELHTRIGSITKPMTATLVLQLVDEGKLALDDTLASMLPAAADFPYADRISLRQLLSMRSGIFNYTEEGILTGLAATPDRVWSDRELLDIARKHEPYFEPGAGFHYSNTNYIMLGMIVEGLTGLTFGDALQQRLFGPLRLTETSLPATGALPDPFSHGYERTPASQADEPGRTDDVGAEQAAIITDATEIAPSIAGAAGAVVSTLGDLNLWLTSLIAGETISESLQRERVTFDPIPRADGQITGFGYGLGVVNFGGMVGHNGGIPGFQSFAGHHLASGTNIIVLANIDSGADGKLPADAIAMALRDLIEGSPASTSA